MAGATVLKTVLSSRHEGIAGELALERGNASEPET